jgi:hypothetical protein
MGIKRSARHDDAPWLRIAQLFPPYRPHFALEQVILPPYSPLSNWPRFGGAFCLQSTIRTVRAPEGC